MATRNFVVQQGLTVGLANIDAATGNVNANNVSLTNAFVVGETLRLSTSNVSLGNVSNLKITGGTNGQFLQTDGTGNMVFATVGTSGISNGNSNVNIPAAAGNVNISVNGNANILVVTDTGVNVAGTFSTGTGNANVGNIGATAGVFTGNVSALNANLGNLATANYVNVAVDLNVTGNANIGGGSGGNITGANLVSANFFTGTLTTAAQPNITSVGTLGNLAVTNTITAGNANITGQYISTLANGTAPIVVNSQTVVANLNADLLDGFDTATAANANTVVVRDANANIAANNISGTLSTASQTNITSVGTLTNLDVSGNAVIGGNLTVNGNLVYVNVETLAIEDPIIQLQTGPNGAAPTSNSGKDVGSALNYYDSQARVAFMGWDVSNAEFGLASLASISSEVVTFSTYGNLRAGVYFGNGSGLTDLAGGNVTGQVGNALVAGTVYTNAQPNITSVGTLTSLAVTGNANVGNVNTGDLAVSGNANIGGGTGGSITGANLVSANFFTGTLTTAAQPNITSVGTLGNLGVSGTITAANITANSGVFTGNGSGLTNLTGGNVTGQVGNALVAGTVYTNAQPNITSVGTLTGLTVNGVSNLTGNGNVIITGGTNGQFLQTNGSGNLSWATIGTSGISNGNSNVNIPAAAGNVNMSVNGNANVLVVTGIGANVSGNLDVTTNITAGNVYANSGTIAGSLLTGTLTTASQPNVTSLGTLTSLTTSGNVTVGGNIRLQGGLTSNRANVAVSTNTVIDEFATSTFRTAKYSISASSDNGHQAVEVLLVQDGSDAYITIYASICSNAIADIITLSANVSGGNAKLYATGSSANVNLVADYIST